MNSTNIGEQEGTQVLKKVRRKRQSQRQKLYNEETPLNVGEARRQIKTALHLHRAASTYKQNQINQSIPQFFPFICIPSTSSPFTNHEFPQSVLGYDCFWPNDPIGPIGESAKESKDLEIIDDQIGQFGFHNVAIGHTQKALEFPHWLSFNDDLLHHQNSNCHSSQLDYCLQHPYLSCLDIGEIEDMDGDWLA